MGVGWIVSSFRSSLRAVIRTVFWVNCQSLDRLAQTTMSGEDNRNPETQRYVSMAGVRCYRPLTSLSRASILLATEYHKKLHEIEAFAEYMMTAII